MADFALWVTACEAGLWEKGTFIKAYVGNIDEAGRVLIEGDIVAAAIIEHMATMTEWTGSAKDLLGALDLLVGEKGMRRREWPKTPRALSGALTRLAPSFRRAGLEVRKLPRDRTGRPLKLEWVGKQPSQPSQRSQTRSFAPLPVTVGDDLRDDGDDQPSRPNPLKSNGRDDGDGRDGHLHTHSGNGAGMSCAQCDGEAEEGNPVMPTVVSDDGAKLPLHVFCAADWFERRGSPDDGDPFASLRDPSLKLQPRKDD